MSSWIVCCSSFNDIKCLLKFFVFTAINRCLSKEGTWGLFSSMFSNASVKPSTSEDESDQLVV